MILTLAAEQKSEHEIAARVRRSKTAVCNVLIRSATPSARPQVGKPRQFTAKSARAIVRKASYGRHSARQLRDMYSAPVTVRRVQQLLQDTAHLQYKRMKCVLKPTPWQKEQRVEWSKTQLRLSRTLWTRIVFSDEKRFCLDGRDGFAYYWADRALNASTRGTSRAVRMGGSGVMVWGAFSWLGKPSLAFISGTLNSPCYVNILDETLLPFTEEKHPNGWRFQQDNAKSSHSKPHERVLYG